MERALDAGAGVVTLEGEAGIGKTALLAALADEAARRDWSVLWGQCVEPGLAPPLWPWIEVLRGLVTAGSGAAFDIAPSLVELAQPVGERATSGQPGRGRRRAGHGADLRHASATDRARRPPLGRRARRSICSPC